PQVGMPSVASRMNLGLPSLMPARYAAALLIAAVVGVWVAGIVPLIEVAMAAAFIDAGATSALVETVQPAAVVSEPLPKYMMPQLTIVSSKGRKSFRAFVIWLHLELAPQSPMPPG